MTEGVLFSSAAGKCGGEAVRVFYDTTDELAWQVLYDVSEGMDTDTTNSTQQWNPFNGDIVAPETWFRLGITRGMLCAYGKDVDSGTLHACVFVFEYAMEHGLLLQSIANELKATGLHVGGIFLSAIEPYSLSFCGVRCGAKTCLTAIRFRRPDPILPTAGPVSCCEMHAILKHACEGTGGQALRDLLHSRDATSGHMRAKKLLSTAVDGKWSVFVQQWMEGAYAALLFSVTSDFGASSGASKIKPRGRALRRAALFTKEDVLLKYTNDN